MPNGKTHDEGFTLVEVMIVGVIIAILVAIAFLSYYSSTARATTIACEHNQRLFTEAVFVYQAENAELPTDIDDLEKCVEDFDSAIECPIGDGTLLEYGDANREVTCANH
jgi:prepilin-type N-terminal cleavage/methylation domain-containing protein